MGCGGGEMVGVRSWYKGDPSSNPAEVYSKTCKLFLINEKESGDGPLKKTKLKKKYVV